MKHYYRIGAPQDYGKAKELLQKSAKQGYPPAQDALKELENNQ